MAPEGVCSRRCKGLMCPEEEFVKRSPENGDCEQNQETER